MHVVFSCPLDPGEALSPKPRRFSEPESGFVGAWPRADSTTLVSALSNVLRKLCTLLISVFQDP